MYIYTYIYLYISMYTCIFIYKYTHTHTQMHMCIYTYPCLCIYVCKYVSIRLSEKSSAWFFSPFLFSFFPMCYFNPKQCVAAPYMWAHINSTNWRQNASSYTPLIFVVNTKDWTCMVTGSQLSLSLCSSHTHKQTHTRTGTDTDIGTHRHRCTKFLSLAVHISIPLFLLPSLSLSLCHAPAGRDFLARPRPAGLGTNLCWPNTKTPGACTCACGISLIRTWDM